MIFFKEGWIYSRESERLLERNFSKGNMKVLVDGVARVYAMEVRTYRVGVDCAAINIDILGQKSSLCPSAMKFSEDREYSKDALLHLGKFIHQIAG